jgi:hypothetical protein
MSQPEKSPCSCDPCDEYALGASSYCIQCTHHNCRYDTPKCPAMERHGGWCDCCSEKTETTRVHNKWLCESCLEYEDAKQSDFTGLNCLECGDSVSLPVFTAGGSYVSSPDDVSLRVLEETDGVYHQWCYVDVQRIKHRREANHSLDSFA